MKIKNTLIALVAVTGFWSVGSNAALLDCAVSDVTFEGNNSNACYGWVDGNDAVSDINAIGGDFGTDIFTSLTKFEEGSVDAGNGLGSIGNIDFTLTADSGSSGDWTLSWTDSGTSDLPITLDFVVTPKSSTSWGAYLFEDIIFTDFPDSGTGTFSIRSENQNGNLQDISHMSIYYRVVPACEGIDCGTQEVPEPEILALFGLGLLGMVAARRRV